MKRRIKILLSLLMLLVLASCDEAGDFDRGTTIGVYRCIEQNTDKDVTDENIIKLCRIVHERELPAPPGGATEYGKCVWFEMRGTTKICDGLEFDGWVWNGSTEYVYTSMELTIHLVDEKSEQDKIGYVIFTNLWLQPEEVYWFKYSELAYSEHDDWLRLLRETGQIEIFRKDKERDFACTLSDICPGDPRDGEREKEPGVWWWEVSKAWGVKIELQ